MNHTLKIHLSKKPKNEGIVGVHRVNIREKILRWMLGDSHRIMIIVPGDSVKELSICEVPDKEREA